MQRFSNTCCTAQGSPVSAPVPAPWPVWVNSILWLTSSWKTMAVSKLMRAALWSAEPLAEAICQGDRQVVALRRVEPMVPHENVEALDLLDQKDNCPACGGYLETRVLLEARTPSPQLFELVRAEPSLLHRSTLLACLTRCEPQRECADRARRRGCRRPGSTP